MVDTSSTEYPSLKTIGISSSQNTSDTSSRKGYEKDGADTPVHNEGDDSIASHKKSTFFVKSYIGQEETWKPLKKFHRMIKSQHYPPTSKFSHT